MNDTTKKTISILGCGWYGIELAKALVEQGHTVKGSSTTPEKIELLSTFKIQPFLINITREEENYDPVFFNTDVLFISIPPKRNTSEQADFFCKIERIKNLAVLHKVKHVIFISSTAVYGACNSEVTELSVQQPETESGKAILKAEQMLLQQNAFTSTIIRFAGLVGPDRHPGRFFAGKTDIPNGRSPINLIHLKDCIGISLAILKNDAFGGVFNACGPDHPCRQDFYALAALNTKQTIPGFKDELLDWKIVSSINSAILNYNYVVTDWMNWLNEQ